MTGHLELWVLGLLAAVAGLVMLSNRLGVPYPVFSEQSESGEEGNGYEKRTLEYQRIRRELLGAERAVLLRLRSEGRISDEVRRRVERDLDLDDARLEI
jgi:hypothetical protein